MISAFHIRFDKMFRLDGFKLILASLFAGILFGQSLSAQESSFEKAKNSIFTTANLRVGGSSSLLFTPKKSLDSIEVSVGNPEVQFTVHMEFFLVDDNIVFSAGIGAVKTNLDYLGPLSFINTTSSLPQPLETSVIRGLVPVSLKYRHHLPNSELTIYGLAGVIFTKAIQREAFIVFQEATLFDPAILVDNPFSGSNMERQLQVGVEFLLSKRIAADISLSHRKQVNSVLNRHDLRLGSIGLNLGVFMVPRRRS